MKPKLILRIAAIVLILHAIGHSMGAFTWQKPDSGIPVEVVQTMQEVHFDFMGKENTMAAMFTGNGTAGIILLLLMSVILWVVSGWNNKFVTKILWIVFCAILVLAIAEVIYFFPMAYMLCFVAAGLVLWGIFKMKKIKE
ncbi:MAG: hypothetical protein FWC34_10800 [Bacteroidetes bacterium]|nr:hypothetical protein [Bacteroidota bacterium]MCL2302734.1 hypothetical protein [Lentimicrobiaceae bacterium]